MAFVPTTAWEVRTTGSDLNSGGFDASGGGTDYSQQDAAQFSGTNLAAANATTDPPIVTSATHNFVAADVGNTINVAAGTNWIPGVYQIASVAANAATLDRPCGTVAVITGGTWKEGGAFATPGFCFGVKNRTPQYGIGNDVWIKAGTYTLTTASTNVAGGAILDGYNANVPDGGVNFENYGKYRGYQTTRGDLGTAPIIKCGGGVAPTYIWHMSGQYTITDNIVIDGNAQTAVSGYYADDFYNLARRVTVQNVTTYGIGLDDSSSQAIQCRVTGMPSGTAAFALSVTIGDGLALYDCEADNNACDGFHVGQHSPAVRCISRNNTGHGFVAYSIGPVFYSCTSYGNTLNGFDDGGRNSVQFIDCVAESNGGLGFATEATIRNDGAPVINCAGYNNTSGNIGGAGGAVFSEIENFVTGTSTFFMNAAGGDFSLNNTAGGGALLRGTGFPSTSPAGSTSSYLDIGWSQHFLAAIVIPFITKLGIMRMRG